MAPLSLKSIVLTTFSYVEDYKVSLQHGLILNRVFPGLVHHEEEENEEEKWEDMLHIHYICWS